MRILKLTSIAVAAVLAVVLVIVTYSWTQTEASIQDYRERVKNSARSILPTVYDPEKITDLPDPVQRYFRYAFRMPEEMGSFVQMTMEGEFRRPMSEDFEPTTAEQTVAIGSPDFVFSATTPIAPGILARVYDAFVDAKMDMKAKIWWTLTVVDEAETPELNRISLRRWLIESPLYPMALLPGGPVRWEAIDENRARAVVAANGMEASLVATFHSDGRLERLDAEADGDLATPYHGSGEHVARSDYRLVSGMMIPHGFTIARAAGGKIYPFWKGQITSIKYLPAK